jgi:hypothetical protein
MQKPIAVEAQPDQMSFETGLTNGGRVWLCRSEAKDVKLSQACEAFVSTCQFGCSSFLHWAGANIVDASYAGLEPRMQYQWSAAGGVQQTVDFLNLGMRRM